MNYKELQDEISILVDSGTQVLEDMIPDLINDAILNIANEPGIVLPALKSIISIDSIPLQPYTNIPSDYDCRIKYASVNSQPVSYNNTLDDLLNLESDLSLTVDITAIALEGTVLWYTRIPSSVTPITLLLYKNPDTLVDDTDSPDEIPFHLHRKTIIPYVAEHLFDMLEQGDEGNKVNTQVQKLKYSEGLQKLREYLSSRRRHLTSSIWNI
jgi:hypothetical protein